MSESKLNLNNENNLSPSSFILDQYFDENEQIKFQFQSPLCLSQIYRKEFFNNFHTNYYGELEIEGIFLASIRYIYQEEASPLEDDKHIQTVRAIIRTSTGNYDVSESSDLIDEENLLRSLLNKAKLSSILHYKVAQHVKANEIIYQFDKDNDERQSNKIGILYQNSNQQDEDEIFSNDQISIKMENFLKSISERVELKNFPKYRADLDIKSNEHGDYSYFTIFNNHQIMFNIAPIIPSDKQFIKRKSLIGNSFLCIVFQEDNTILNPNIFSGKVTQAYITVQPIYIDNELYYKIRIWRRPTIKPLIDPPGGIYKHDQYFRDKFLTLILNSMNTILEQGSLHSKITQQQERVKYEQLIRLISTFSLHSKLNTQSDDDYLNHSDSETETQRKTKRNLNLRTKNRNMKNNVNSSKRHSSGIFPKLTEAFHKVRPKLNFSLSDTSIPNLMENQPSPFYNQHHQSFSDLNNRQPCKTPPFIKLPAEHSESLAKEELSLLTPQSNKSEEDVNKQLITPTKSLVSNTFHLIGLYNKKPPLPTSPIKNSNEENSVNDSSTKDKNDQNEVYI